MGINQGFLKNPRLIFEFNLSKINQRDLVGLIIVMMRPGEVLSYLLDKFWERLSNGANMC